MSNGSNILAVVGGVALTACTVGVHLVQALMPQPHPPVPQPRPAIVAQQTTTIHTTAPVAPRVQPPASQVKKVVPQAPQTTYTTTTNTTSTTPAQPDPVITGNQATYTNQDPLYRVTYPSDWNATSSSTTYGVVSPDDNAGVAVYIVASAPMDTSGLMTALNSELPYLLQRYGGSATSTPTYKSANVDGIPAVTSDFYVTKNGLEGEASVAAVYKDGDIYYVCGVIADESTATGSQEGSQVNAIMDSFQLS